MPLRAQQVAAATPSLTTRSLIEGYQRYASLSQVEAEISRRDAEKQSLDKELEALRATIESTKNSTLNAITEARATAEKELKKIGAEATKELKTSLDDSSRRFEAMLNGLDVRWGNISSDIKRWGEVRQEIGAYEEQIKLGYIFYGIMTDPEAVTRLTRAEITPIVSKINHWTTYNLKGAKTKPSPTIAETSSGLSRYTEYEVVAITRMLEEYFLGVHTP